MDEAKNAVQLGKCWPEVSLYTEELQLLRVSSDMRLDSTLTRHVIEAGTAGDWLEWLNSDKPNAWTKVKLQECHHEVKQEGTRSGTPQQDQALLGGSGLRSTHDPGRHTTASEWLPRCP